MTREEAIEILNEIKEFLKEEVFDSCEEDDIEALNMAIRALENHDTFMKYSYSLGKHDALLQEPTEICCATCKHERPIQKGYECDYQDECLTEGKRGKYEFAYAKYEPIVEQQPCDKCAMNGSGSKYCDNCGQKSEKWIPVSERLPEEGQRVHVTQTVSERTVVYCTTFPFEKIKGKYITAWMPLPEPYEPQESEEEQWLQ